MYARDIPALRRATRPSTNFTPAPAVVAGTPLNDSLLVAAIKERQCREAWYAAGEVTPTELADAIVRECAVVAEHAAVRYPRPQHPTHDDAPQWFADDMSAPNDHKRCRHEALDQLKKSTDSRFAEMERRVMFLTNDAIMAGNARVVAKLAADETMSQYPLTPLIRVNDRPGAGIPGYRLQAAAIPHVAVGDPIPSPPFPDTIEEIGTMTMTQINTLAVLLDTDFGIDEDEDVTTCRLKVRQFVQYGL